ncbi:DUF1878 family protein [Ornithinibacillus xuwenensis]|uniref:DUF1878 family protein n=1 Tax=Ornithinibacillus xuwenensis TaxID=3144668 RepID=A0ABU9XHF2_9BACI
MCEVNNLATFQLQLLSRTIDETQYPFTKLVIERNITEEEYDELFQLLGRIEEQYLEQKEEGLLNFSSLLVCFAGMLNEKLEPTETVMALKDEGYFPLLLEEFIKLINEGKL